MRVISGSAGGLRLKVPASGVRPSTDRTKSAVFSWLGETVAGARVLDLFAGSGGLGIEALSRGAQAAVFVESSPSAARCLRENLAHTGLAGGRVIESTAERFLARGGGGTFDIVLADPPWVERGADRDWVGWILAREELPAMVAEDGWFILEAPSGRCLDGGGLWEERDRRRYGTTTVWFWRARKS